MAAVLLDTTVLIDLLRGRAKTVERLLALRDAGDTSWTCAINVEEIARGLLEGEEDAARTLFAGLRIADLGDAEAWRAGAWRRAFASRGRTLSQADCLIAAAAFSIRARLATGNPRDFPMEEVAIEEWLVGA